jgi:ABC-2 type transport system permease protein
MATLAQHRPPGHQGAAQPAARPRYAGVDRLRVQFLDLHRRHGDTGRRCARPPIAVIDEDRSPLSERIVDALYPPYFMPPARITLAELDARMDAGLDTFALYIPAGFQRDVLARRAPAIQLSVDATRMSQAFTGSGHIQTIVLDQVNEFVRRNRAVSSPPVELVLRARFNPELNKSWFGGLMQIINNITMLSIVLTGAALIRERETRHPRAPAGDAGRPVRDHGLEGAGDGGRGADRVGLRPQCRRARPDGVPIEGSLPLFFVGAALHLFATTSLGIFLATLARSMPQFGMLLLMVLLPLQMLSGGRTPRESMPEIVQFVMLAAPNTHFVMLSHGILYRGAGLEVVWPQLISLAVIGLILFMLSLARFRKTLALLC